MTLVQRQIELEQKYTTEGVLRTIRQWEKDLEQGRVADTTIGRAITIRCYHLVRNELEGLVNAGTRGMGGKYRGLIRDIGIDKAAIIALRTALQCTPETYNGFLSSRRDNTRVPVVQTYLSLASAALEVEFMITKLSIAAPIYVDKVVKSMEEARTRSVNHRTRTLRKTAENVGVSVDRVVWDTSTRMGVGKILIEAVISAGIMELYDLPTKTFKPLAATRLTPEVNRSMQYMVKHLRAAIIFPPSLVPPKPHTKEHVLMGSSYITDDMYARAPTVLCRKTNKEHSQWVKDNMSQEVLDAANRTANVAYVLDSWMLTQLRDASKQAGPHGLAGLPGYLPIRAPAYPLPEGWDREDEELKEIHEYWKHQAKAAYTEEIERKSKVLQFSLCMKYMEEFKEDTLYFPTFFDWRGRLYFRTKVNPQGADFVKASLRFKEGKALGAKGLYWLKVHVATCYGFDKANFDTRAAWVDKNMHEIRLAVSEGIDSEFFLAADSPWCFLAAAKDFLEAMDSKHPEQYISHIPVAMDATCSGLQVLSALLRDPVGGMMVNLLPNNGVEKEDIYAGVAAIAISNVQKDTENPELSAYWLTSGIPRSMAKRPVMTYVYGGTLISSSDYVRAEMKERGMEAIEGYSEHKLSMYAARHLRRGVETAVPAAAECMRFLRTLAGSMPDTEPLRWITPVGFPVCHHYGSTEVKRLNLPGIGIQVSFKSYNDDVMDRKHSMNGISPNFVHSLDSAHLVSVINNFEGSITPIHDSFATHAADVDEMHRVLRDRFVWLHKNNAPLQQLIDCVEKHTGVKLPHPTLGTLDIDKVKESKFFMC